ncbi:MAG TPA: HAD family phosphatase [Candidatus Aminicenantes bacterium]|nr:HAD family phosphatase [Candidatus Aminicenantes bacterium]
MKTGTTPRLVASDLGGTLVPLKEEAVPPATLAVLDAIMALGVPVALVTGFNLYTARRMAAGLKRSPWLLVQNGTLALKNNKIVWEHGLAADEAKKLVRTLEALKVPVVVYRSLSRGGSPEYRGFGMFSRSTPFRTVEEFSDFSDITGVSTRIANDRVGEVKTALNSCLPVKSRLISSRGNSRTWLEVTPVGARKDQALRRLCTELGVDPQQVIYFGDNLNDLEALEMVGFPRVVADGLAELRNLFPQVAAASHQGPARELVRLFELEQPPGL